MESFATAEVGRAQQCQIIIVRIKNITTTITKLLTVLIPGALLDSEHVVCGLRDISTSKAIW
jgi:hypothetical protein